MTVAAAALLPAAGTRVRADGREAAHFTGPSDDDFPNTVPKDVKDAGLSPEHEKWLDEEDERMEATTPYVRESQFYQTKKVGAPNEDGGKKRPRTQWTRPTTARTSNAGRPGRARRMAARSRRAEQDGPRHPARDAGYYSKSTITGA